MKVLQIDKSKIRVNFFQRKPRRGFNFSIEYIFEDIRKRLSDRIDAHVYISKCYNDGYYTKFINIIEAALRQSYHVNHITGETHFLNMLMNKKNVILTIHDCAMVKRKTGIKKKIIQLLYLDMPAKKAKIITANSEITKQDIVSYTNINPDNIRVIPVAINQIYQPLPKLFNKKKPIILQIGTGYNKNLVRLIEAIHGINCQLIIIGKLSQDQFSALEKNEIDYINEHNISEKSILEKYHQCDILTFISTFEGFGMPIVEANSVERVVVTGNISAMPEVAGDSACFVDPFDVEDIRAGIIKVINDDLYREILIKNGRLNKRRFDAARIADMYFELYKEIFTAE